MTILRVRSPYGHQSFISAGPPAMIFSNQGQYRPNFGLPPVLPSGGLPPFPLGFPFHGPRRRRFLPCIAHARTSPHHHGHRGQHECCHGECRGWQPAGADASPLQEASASPTPDPSHQPNATAAAGEDEAIALEGQDVVALVEDIRRKMRELEVELARIVEDNAGK